MMSIPAKTKSPSTRLCHSGRCVVSALDRQQKQQPDAAHNCSTQADLAGRARACSRVRPQTMKNAWTSQSARPSNGCGSRRLAHRNAVIAIDKPAMLAMFGRSTRRKPKSGTIRVRQLLSPLYGPHNQACAHHGRAHEADEKVQPSHFGVAEAPEVERVEYARVSAAAPTTSRTVERFAGGPIELHVLRAHGNASRFSSRHRDARGSISGMNSGNPPHIVSAPTFLGLPHHVGH